jgi:hypothetical protein
MAPHFWSEKYILHYYKTLLCTAVLVKQFFARNQISVLEYAACCLALALFDIFMSPELWVEISMRGPCLESFEDKGCDIMEIPKGCFENYFQQSFWLWQRFLMCV